MTTLTDTRTDSWMDVAIAGHGYQSHLERAWRCDPAWDVNTLQREADGSIPHPKSPSGAQAIFRDRHIDRRFEIAYPRSTPDGPRPLSATFGDAAKDWQSVRDHVDRYLGDAGLTEQSPQEDIARCMADTFKADSYFKDKPSCMTFGERTRQLTHPVEGLLHQSFCVGCAHAFAAMADMAGLMCRTIGCGAHRLAEVLIDGRWRMVENSCRHESSRGLEALMPASYMEVTMYPERFPYSVPPKHHDGYRGMPSGQYHFMGGRWQSPPTMRFAAINARALYPELSHWLFKSCDGKRMPLVANAGGFYWEDAPAETDEVRNTVNTHRAAVMPFDVDEVVISDYMFTPLDPGATLRQTVWLDDVDDVEGLEVVMPMPPNLDDAMGEQLTLAVNGASRNLKAWGAWPATQRVRTMLGVTVTAPTELLLPNKVNAIELRNGSKKPVMMPFVPAAALPYIPPLLPG